MLKNSFSHTKAVSQGIASQTNICLYLQRMGQRRINTVRIIVFFNNIPLDEYFCFKQIIRHLITTLSYNLELLLYIIENKIFCIMQYFIILLSSAISITFIQKNYSLL